jgi:hypothetical protein
LEVRAKDWDYRRDKPIDFVSLEQDNGVGVELCEWMDREEAQSVAERDRFCAEIQLEIDRRGPRSHCIVQVCLTKLPGRTQKAKVLEKVVEFIVEFVRTKKAEIDRTGIAEASGPALPASLAPFFTRIVFTNYPTRGWVSLTKPWTFGIAPVELDSAARSLRQALTGKTVAKTRIYEAEKRQLALSELWLVVHYSSPDRFAAPLYELQLQVSYGRERGESQDRVAAMASTLLSEIGKGPFDRVFLMIECQELPSVSELGLITSTSSSP